MSVSTEKCLELARSACEAAVKVGAEFAEATVGSGRSTSVRLERSAVDSTSENLNSGASIRAFVKGGQGTFTLDGLDPDAIASGAVRAAEMARAAEPDKDFRTLPAPANCVDVPGLYDPRLESIGIAELARVAMECVEAALAVAPEAVCTGSAGVSISTRAVANSLGIAQASQSSFISAWIEPIIRRGDDVGAFYDFDQGRLLDDFDHRTIGTTAAETALKFLGARKIESGTMPIVLGPLCSGSILSAIAQGADAESHQRNRNWLAGKVGQKIASDILTVRDDATIPAGLASRAFDSEGVPTRPITIMENGVLVNLLHNSYTANKAGAPYTGHARGGGVSASNVNAELGRVSSDDIIRNTTRGLYINMGSVRPDASTGEVSATVDFGFLIENGELSYPVAGSMVGINGFDLLNNIDAISSDVRMLPGQALPTIRIQNARIAGAR